MYVTGISVRGRREINDESKGVGGNCVGEKMEGTDLEVTMTINIALFCIAPLPLSFSQPSLRQISVQLYHFSLKWICETENKYNVKTGPCWG
jgi:hypothetical protein